MTCSCGAALTGRRKQCGADACRKAFNALRMRQRNERIRAETGKSMWQTMRPKKSADACPCGALLYHGTRCKPCGDAARRDAAALAAVVRARRRSAERRLARAARGTVGSGFIAGFCARCGASYVGRRDGVFCGPRCADREANSTRRALSKGAKITPGRRHAVYERDNWTCRLCERPINRLAVVPHPDAGTIDHVVPLARGGAHAQENWQTAHFLCNSFKRDVVAA